jgi:hypothetical protein
MAFFITVYFVVGLFCFIGGVFRAFFGNHLDEAETKRDPGLQAALVEDRIEFILLIGFFAIFIWPLMLVLRLAGRAIDFIRDANIARNIKKN